MNMKMIKKYIIATIGVLALVSCEKEEMADQSTNDIITRDAQGAGIAGSMAQFAILDDYLYSINSSSLKVFDISDPKSVDLLQTIQLGNGIETIFPRNGYLFIGAEIGVKIFDVSNPRYPVQVSEFEHGNSCDPVVANDKFAFSTLRNGNLCDGNLNELDIIRISDIRKPKLVRIKELTNPHGLALSATDDSTLFVCDGYAGLKVLDLYNLPHPDRPLNTDKLEVVNHIEGLEAIDVISTENKELIVLTPEGIHLFDATDRLNLIEKSVITR